nr:hypothetical protein B0A51_02619 [Rachicladosporium sp. CCFEE 5018]
MYALSSFRSHEWRRRKDGERHYLSGEELDVKGAPEELKAIANDANAFSAQVLAVKASLADAEIARLVDRTEVIRGLMANMRDAMQNCADACQSLLLKLGSHATLTMTGLSIARDLGWMFKKKDILAAVQRLANTKLSLTASYSSATLVMQMHSAVLASGNAATVQINPAKITGAGINVASTLGQYAASLAATPDSISGRSYRLAIDAGDVDLVERMLDQGIGIDTVLDEGHTALLQAVVNKDLTMMQLLLNRGASPHAIWMYTTVVTNYDVQVEEEDQQKDTVLHLAIRAWQSADECHAMVLTLVQSGADVNATNANGDAPLNLLLREAAGQQGCDKVVRVLIEHGASLDWRNNAGDTLLSSTLCGQYPWGELDKRIDLVGLLLDSGASPRALTYNGATLLHEMIEDRRLVPGGPLATRDRRTSFDRLMDMLLFHGFDAVSLDLQGRPILAAIIMGGVLDWFDIFNSPLTRFGDGRTLLHNTIVEELRETLMALAYSINCPGYVDVRDHKGQTACGLAGRMYREGWHDNFGAMLTAGGRRTIGTALSMLDIDQAKDEELAQALGLTVIENNVSTGAWSMGALGLSNELSWRKFTDPYSEPGLLQMPEAWRQASGYLSKYQRDHFNALPRFASTAPNPLKIRRTQDDILHLVAKASAEKKRLTATYKGHGDVNPDGLHRRVQITNHIFARKPDMATWSPSGEPTCLNRFSLREGLERHWAASEWCQLYFERYVNVDWKAIAAQPEYQKIRELVMRDQKLVDAMSRVPVR